MKNQKLKKSIKFGSDELKVDIGNIAVQAYGAVELHYQNNVVLSTTSYKKQRSKDASFLALSVNYIEKYYAIGKIPGGFLKREGRPSDSEILVSRIIDRSIRPTLPDDFLNETQIITNLLSYGKESKPDVSAMIASSISAAISGLPIEHVVASCRVGKIDGKFVINPSIKEMQNSSIDLIASYTKESVLMIECEGKEVSDEDVVAAIEFGKQESLCLLNFIEELTKELSVQKISYEASNNEEIISIIKNQFIEEVKKCALIADKIERNEYIDVLKIAIKSSVDEKLNEDVSANRIEESFKKIFKEIMRSKIAQDKVRIDKRSLDEIRPLSIVPNYLPKENVHGSALFSRGETQVLGVCTLGDVVDAQIIDSVTKMDKDPFMLHYNFPPSSVNEVSALRGVGRREVGHGNLIKKSILPILPSSYDFDYTIRSVCEVVSCNGSSSMGSVSASSLSMMCAGVPLKNHIAGIAIGLIQEGDENLILTDIMADEDFLGDIDFKVAGTKNGITSLQMDVKIDTLRVETIKQALQKAHVARNTIIDKMEEALPIAKLSMNSSVPLIESMKIDRKDIPLVIGKKGITIQTISKESGCSLNIDDKEMIIKIKGSKEQIEKAKIMIADSTKKQDNNDKNTDHLKSHVDGDIYSGKIIKTNDFGIIVESDGFNSVLVHYKDLKIDQYSIKKIDLNLTVNYKYLGKDTQGRSRVTIKEVDQTDSDFINFIANNKYTDSTKRPRGNNFVKKTSFNKKKKKNIIAKILEFLKV